MRTLQARYLTICLMATGLTAGDEIPLTPVRGIGDNLHNARCMRGTSGTVYFVQYRRSRSMTRARPARKSREYNMTVRAASAEAWYVATDGEGIPRTRPIPGVPRFCTSTVRRAESISSKPGTVDSPDRDSARRTDSPEGDTDARRRPLPDPRSRARVSRTGRGLFSIHPANVARWLR